jgi:hypothetical protein
MGWRSLQFFSLATSFFVFVVPLHSSPAYALNFTDVDRNNLSTSDGHVTIVAMAKEADLDKVRRLGDRVPEFCLGDPKYRLITLVVFEENHSPPVRASAEALARRRLDAEARRLQVRYTARKITRNPRSDVYAALDFDGTIARRLGASANSTAFQIWVLDRKGKLLRHWDDVPSAGQLARVLR